MNILALDTATEACSVALLREDSEVFSEFEVAPRQHNRLLPMMLDKVLTSAGIDQPFITHCAYTNGPGAFTGVRIGTAQAQGIGLALGIPLIPISTLAVMAQQCFDDTAAQNVLASIDARMGEIYWGQYQKGSDGLADLVAVERLTSLDADLPVDGVEAIIGSGASVIAADNAGFPGIQRYVDYLPKAGAMLQLALRLIKTGQFVTASAAPINYLRNQVAVKAKQL